MASNYKRELLNSESEGEDELQTHPGVSTRTKQKNRVPIEADIRVSNELEQDERSVKDRDLGNGNLGTSSQVI